MKIFDVHAAALATIEPAERFSPDAIIAWGIKLDAHGEPQPVLDFFEYFPVHSKHYPTARRWLENDPRTVLTGIGPDLLLSHVEQKDGYAVQYRLQIELHDDEIELLKSLGKIVTNHYSYSTIAC